MRRWGHRRYTSTRHCSGGVLAVGAMIVSAPVLNFLGLGKAAVARRSGAGDGAATFNCSVGVQEVSTEMATAVT
jgi:hypothetical protein